MRITLLLILINIIITNAFLNIFNNNLINERSQLVNKLIDNLKVIKNNGLDTDISIKNEIALVVDSLETLNPTKDPAYSPLMNGFWKLLYTDYNPPGPSSGKLGPFLGLVYQDLDSTKGVITNILRIAFPPIVGALVAEQSIENKNTWRITFDRIANKILGIKLPTSYFKPGSQIRLWEIVYLDESLRILRARKVDADRKDSFIFILARDEKSKFKVNI